MKKHIIYFILALVFIAGCTKKDGPVPEGVNLERVPLPQIDKTAGNLTIDLTNLAAFKGTFTVGLYFPNDAPPAKMDIVIMKNNDTFNIKVFKAAVTTFPSTYDITAADLAALFGTTVKLGDNYDIGADVYTQEGRKYNAWVAFSGIPITRSYATGIAGQPGSTTSTRYSAICAYDPAVYQGNFVVVNDDFQDFSPGEIVVLTRLSNTSFSFIDPYATSPLPIIVNVNPATNTVSITKQKIGNAFVWNLTYTNPNVAASGTGNSVAPCDKLLNLNIAYTVDQGSFGTYALVMRKQ